MTKDLILQGKKFISSRRAAEMTGYTNDYIGQLCRGGKVKAQLVGRNWYVEEQSLFAHKLANGKTPPKVFDNFFSDTPPDSVSRVSYKAEGGSFLPALKTKLEAASSGTSNKDARNVISSYYPKVNNLLYSELSKKIIALSLSMVIVFGSAFLSQSEEFANGLTKNSQRAVVFGESVFSGAKYAFSEPEMALNTFGELITEAQKNSESLLAFAFDSGIKLFAKNFNNFVNEGVSDLSLDFISWFKDGNSIASKIYPIEEIENKKSFETKIARSQPPLVVTGVTKVVERFTERVVSGVSSEELDLKLQQLNNKLSGEIYRLSSENNGLAGYPSGVFTVASQAHRIDKLSNTTVTNPTISGGSWSDANVSGTLSGTFSGTISSGGTTTLNNLTVSNTSTSTFSGGVSSARLNTSATSTLAGLQVATGGLTISTLNCSAFTNGGTLTTDSNGNVICDDDGGSGGGGTDTNWSFFNGSGIKLATTTNQVLIGGSATTSLAQLEVQGSIYSSGFLGIATTSPFSALSVVGNGFISGTLSLANISATGTLSVSGLSSLADVSFANATGTAFFATTASSTQLNTLNATSSQSFFSALGTFTKALFTDATSTSFFANIASSTTAFFNNATSTTLGVTGNLTVQGAGTSTITNGLSVGGLTSSNGITVTGGGTSTFAGGLQASGLYSTGNGLRVAGLTSCDTIDTDSSGNFTCGTDATTVGSGSSNWVYNNPSIFYRPATSTAVVLIGGTSTTSLAKLEVQGSLYSSGNLFVGTTTGADRLSIYGTSRFQTPVNSTTAFQILTAASSSIFTADTVSGEVTIPTFLFTQATGTSFFATTASSTRFNTLNATSSQSFFSALGTFTKGLFTNATTSSLAVTGTATTTFGGPLASASGNFIIGSNTNTGNLLLQPYGGNVGIGTSTPNALLTISNFTASSAITSPAFFNITETTGTGNLSPTRSFFRISYASSTEIFGKVIDPEFIAEELGPTPGTSLNGTHSVFVSGNYAYVANANRDSLAVIDISNPADPVFVSEEQGPTPGTSLDNVTSVFVSGNYAYMASYTHASLAVIDISNPADPVFVSEELGPTPGTSLDAALSVFVSGNYAYMASYSRDSLAVIDISNPADPVFVSEERGPTPGTSLDGAYSVFVSGNYAYVANELRDSLAVIDISNPADPVFVSEELGLTPGTSLDGARSVFVSGNYAYIANRNRDSLAVIDISNPADPVFISEELGPTPGTSLDAAASVFVSGNYAYVASYTRASLAVIDIGGATISNLAAGTAKIGNLQVDSFAQFAQGALFGGGLGVQGSIFANQGGSFTRIGTSSSLSSTTLAWGSTPVLPALSALVHDANIGSITDIFSISHTATGTVANGIGAGILFSTEVGTQGVTSSSTEATSTARIAAVTTNISTSTPKSALTFSTKGTSGSLTEWARLDYGGNFGLGTTTPNWTLSVASITPYIALTDTDATLNNKHWLLGNNGGTFTIGTSTDSFSATSTYFSISNSGNVGIGTTTSYAKLGVEINNEPAFVVSNTGSSTPSIYIGSVSQNGFVGFGTTTNPASSLARLVIDNPSLGSSTGATSAVGGIFGVYTFNGNGGATQIGNRFVFQNAPTITANTVVGEILRGVDNTALANTFRAMEVTASGGSNTSGENTGIRTTGATFGLSATTLGTAGAVLAPAALYAETQGTTQGEALRGFSSTLTSGNFTHLFQQDSAFTGIGLKMDFGRGTGSFTGDFLSLEVNDSPRFRIQAGGTTTIGTAGSTANQAGLQIGYGGLCVDNDGTCTATTTGRITAVEYNTANSDLAENYYSSEALESGDIVYAMGGLQVGKAGAEAAPVIGVVSTKPGITLGAKESTGDGSEYAIGLSGRVPVKVSNQNGSIRVGDRVTLSSLSGIGMKDGDSSLSPIVGIALETFDGSKYLSEETIAVETKQVEDGPPVCRTVLRPGGNIEYGGGGDIEDGKISNPSASTVDLYDEICETKMITVTPDAGVGEEKTLATTTVKVGKIMLFINLDYRKSELSVTNKMAETPASDWQSNGWSVNQDSGKISVNFFGDVNFGGNTLLDVGRIAGINSAWSVDETGALVVDSVKAKRGQFENALEIGTKEKPAGVTIFDSATGEPACIRVSNGALVSSAGSCDDGSSVPTVEIPNLEAKLPSDTEAPVISLNGNNPAIIKVGDTYADLGATVTDNVNENLGYTISIDGVNYMDPSALSLDTTAPAIHTLTFKAVDQAGNVGEAVRKVEVEALVAVGGSVAEPPTDATQPPADTTTPQPLPEPPPLTTESTQTSEPSATTTP